MISIERQRDEEEREDVTESQRKGRNSTFRPGGNGMENQQKDEGRTRRRMDRKGLLLFWPKELRSSQVLLRSHSDWRGWKYGFSSYGEKEEMGSVSDLLLFVAQRLLREKRSGNQAYFGCPLLLFFQSVLQPFNPSA